MGPHAWEGGRIRQARKGSVSSFSLFWPGSPAGLVICPWLSLVGTLIPLLLLLSFSFAEGEVVRFSPSGQSFAILSTTTIDLYTKDMSPILTLTNAKRFHDFHFLEVPSATEGGEPREMIFAAVEDGFTRVWERVGGRMGDLGVKEEGWTEIVRLGGHANRYVLSRSFFSHFVVADFLHFFLRDISVKSISPLYPLISSISSDGFVNLYDLTLLPPTPATASPQTSDSNPNTSAAQTLAVPVQLPQGQYDTKGTRLTCVTMAEGERGVEGVDEEDVEGDEEEWGVVQSDSDEEETDDGVEDSEDEDGEGFSGEDGMSEDEDEMEGEDEDEMEDDE